jgi:hypothetical protein
MCDASYVSVKENLLKKMNKIAQDFHIEYWCPEHISVVLDFRRKNDEISGQKNKGVPDDNLENIFCNFSL